MDQAPSDAARDAVAASGLAGAHGTSSSRGSDSRPRATSPCARRAMRRAGGHRRRLRAGPGWLAALAAALGAVAAAGRRHRADPAARRGRPDGASRSRCASRPSRSTTPAGSLPWGVGSGANFAAPVDAPAASRRLGRAARRRFAGHGRGGRGPALPAARRRRDRSLRAGRGRAPRVADRATGGWRPAGPTATESARCAACASPAATCSRSAMLGAYARLHVRPLGAAVIRRGPRPARGARAGARQPRARPAHGCGAVTRAAPSTSR